MKVRAEDHISEGAVCYVDIEADGTPKVGRLYSDATVESPLVRIAAREILRGDEVEFHAEKDTADLLMETSAGG